MKFILLMALVSQSVFGDTYLCRWKFCTSNKCPKAWSGCGTTEEFIQALTDPDRKLSEDVLHECGPKIRCKENEK